MADKLRQLRWYAENGYAIFPCKPNEKVPATAHGFKDATTDLAQIESWHRAMPDANWAMATGETFVVDIDGGEGAESWCQLRESNPTLIQTVEVLTPHDGRHLWFKPNGAKATIGAGKLGPHLDHRGEGGYVLVPPSQLDGTPYRFINSPVDTPLQDLPEWIPALLNDKPDRGLYEPAAIPTMVGIPEGKRNDTLASLAGTMRRRGMTEAAILEALKAENAARCVPPLEASEVEVIAASVGRYTPDDRATDWIGQGFDALQAVERPPAREWVIHGLVRDLATTLLVADYAHHKSNLQIAFGLCVALGRDFAGLSTQKRPVLMVCQDQARERIVEVLHAMMEFYGQPVPGAFTLFSYPQPPLALIGDLAPFEEAITALERPLLLVDSLTACAGTTEENTGDMAKAARMLDALRTRHQATALMNHHTPHGQLRSRGNRLIVAAVENSLLVKRDNRPDGDFISFQTEKPGSAPMLTDLVLRFTYEAYPDSALMRTAGFERAKDTDAAPLEVVEAAEEIRAYIGQHGACSGRELRKPKKAGGLGLNGARVALATKYGEGVGWLRRDAEGKFYVPAE